VKALIQTASQPLTGLAKISRLRSHCSRSGQKLHSS